MPGTTLGLINVPGLPLGPKNRAFDTPGVAHAYQLTSHLGLEDVKKVLPSKQLKGRVSSTAVRKHKLCLISRTNAQNTVQQVPSNCLARAGRAG